MDQNPTLRIAKRGRWQVAGEFVGSAEVSPEIARL
jgi:hypothetical protein